MVLKLITSRQYGPVIDYHSSSTINNMCFKHCSHETHDCAPFFFFPNFKSSYLLRFLTKSRSTKLKLHHFLSSFDSIDWNLQKLPPMAESMKKQKGSSTTTTTAGHRRHGPSEAPTTPVAPSLSSPWSSTLFSLDDQRLQYSSQFSTRTILDPKYLDTTFFDDETFDCYQVFQNSGLVDFMSLKLPHYPELVRVFYNNLRIQDSTLYSEVHGIPLVIDHSLFFSLTKLPIQGVPFEGTVVDDWKFDYSSHGAHCMVCNDRQIACRVINLWLPHHALHHC